MTEEFYIGYTIDNVYETPVRKANFQLLVLPAATASQTVTDVNISCSESNDPFMSDNVFGFETISYYLDKPVSRFFFQLTAKVVVEKLNPFRITELLPAEEFAAVRSDDFQIDNHLFLSPTALTHTAQLQDIGFPVYTAEQSMYEYLIGLNSFIHHLLVYSPASTDVDTSIAEVLKIRKGVCQDFAHLFISVCRHNKIAARYVSGYLSQGEGFTGAGQLHAWAEVLIPGLDWIGFDATNNLLADYHYIKIAHGTDYRDCSPIIGILDSAGKQNSNHLVIVTTQQQ